MNVDEAIELALLRMGEDRSKRRLGALGGARELMRAVGCDDPGGGVALLTRIREMEKQASRDADALALASGEKTREQLREENAKVRIARVHWDRIKAPK